MYSSKWKHRIKRSIEWFELCGGILLVACTGALTSSGNTNAAHSSASCAIVEGKPSLQDAGLAKALQRNIETSPLYSIPATSGLPICRIRYYPEGAIGLEYHFREGGWLQVKRDERIEYTEQNAHFNLTSKEQPEAILAQAELAAFGAEGCGIDWHQSETQQAEDDRSVTETIFRGDVCNCQARIRRNASGRVVGLMLRSAC